MSAAFLETCGHGTERMIGSAPGPAKVATRMLLLRMDFGSSCAGRAPQTISERSRSPAHSWKTLLLEDGLPGQARGGRNRRSSIATFTARDLLDVVHQHCKLATREGIAAARADALGVSQANSRFAEAKKFFPHAAAVERQRGVAGNMGHGSLLARRARGDAHARGPAARVFGEQAFVRLNFDLRH